METISDYELKAEECLELNCIFKEVPEISKVILYGSRVIGDFRENTDIDLSLVGKCLTEQHLLKTRHLLYESRLPYFADVYLFSGISNNDFINKIQRKEKIKYWYTGEK